MKLLGNLVSTAFALAAALAAVAAVSAPETPEGLGLAIIAGIFGGTALILREGRDD